MSYNRAIVAQSITDALQQRKNHVTISYQIVDQDLIAPFVIKFHQLLKDNLHSPYKKIFFENIVKLIEGPGLILKNLLMNCNNKSYHTQTSETELESDDVVLKLLKSIIQGNQSKFLRIAQDENAIHYAIASIKVRLIAFLNTNFSYFSELISKEQINALRAITVLQYYTGHITGCRSGWKQTNNNEFTLDLHSRFSKFEDLTQADIEILINKHFRTFPIYKYLDLNNTCTQVETNGIEFPPHETHLETLHLLAIERRILNAIRSLPSPYHHYPIIQDLYNKSIEDEIHQRNHEELPILEQLLTGYSASIVITPTKITVKEFNSNELRLMMLSDISATLADTYQPRNVQWQHTFPSDFSIILTPQEVSEFVKEKELLSSLNANIFKVPAQESSNGLFLSPCYKLNIRIHSLEQLKYIRLLDSTQILAELNNVALEVLGDDNTNNLKTSCGNKFNTVDLILSKDIARQQIYLFIEALKKRNFNVKEAGQRLTISRQLHSVLNNEIINPAISESEDITRHLSLGNVMRLTTGLSKSLKLLKKDELFKLLKECACVKTSAINDENIKQFISVIESKIKNCEDVNRNIIFDILFSTETDALYVRDNKGKVENSSMIISINHVDTSSTMRP